MAVQCVEVQEWIEEEITKPVEEWVEETEKKCKNYPWYDPRGWVCWLVTIFVKVVIWVVEKVGKWVVRTVCTLINAAITLITGVLSGLWDVIVGIFTLDWRRILDGLMGIGLAVVDAVLTFGRVIFLLDTLAYIIDEYERGELRDHVRGLLEGKYSGEQLKAIKGALRVDHGAFGFRLSAKAIRTFIDSETPSPRNPGIPNLIALHEAGAINLRELCGFEFPQGFWNRKRYKTLKKGITVSGGGGGEFDNPISADELDTYISSRGADGPKFIVLCMRDSVLETKLEAARLKGREIGLMLKWSQENKEVIKAEHIVHPGFDTTIASSSEVSFLKEIGGRIGKAADPAGATNDLCQPLAAGVFRYTDTLRGLAACLAGSSQCQAAHDASGVTFIDNHPDIVWKYVPIHELGHFFGLCHVDGLDRIMYSSKQNSWFAWTTLPNLLLLYGEPTFTLDEGKQAWDYIVANYSPDCLAKG